MIPTWLQRQLEEAGRWNTDGVGRGLSAGRCSHCQAQVIRGLDADVAGLPATCDPATVDNLGEALALLAGRWTYTVQHVAGRWQLSHRDQWRIRAGNPATVLASHQCHSPPLPAGQPLHDPTPTFDQEPAW
jgi:hypothetical protein